MYHDVLNGPCSLNAHQYFESPIALIILARILFPSVFHILLDSEDYQKTTENQTHEKANRQETKVTVKLANPR